MSSRAKSIVLLAGSVSILGLSYLLVGTTPGKPGQRALVPGKDPPASAALAALAPLEVEEPSSSDTREVASARSAMPIERLEPRRSTTRSIAGGRLRVRAIASETRDPLQHVRVRAVSSRRLADRESDGVTGEIELTLTPDTYSLLVEAKGYEPRELDPVRIVAGETVSLDPTALSPGGARILGVVTGMEPGRTLEIELLGDGRRPCERCATEPNDGESLPPGPIGAWKRRSHCIDCGYAEVSTRLKLPSSGGFTFDRLVSGVFALRLTERGDRTLGKPMVLELRAEETLPVSMEALRTRSLRVEMFDTDGSPLATEWSRRVRQSAAIEVDAYGFLEVVEAGVRPVSFACTFRAEDVCLARADFCSPFVGVRSWGFGSCCGIGLGERRTENDDRPRGDSETLRPDRRMPEVEPMYVDSVVDAEGLVQFELVPSMALTLELGTGPFTATVSVPDSHEPARVSARLTRNGSSADSSDSESMRNASTFLEYEAIHDRGGNR